LLIRFDGRILEHAAVEEWVVRRSAYAGFQLTGRLVEIPTLYNGPDLVAVACHCGLSTRDVVDVHSSCEYVAWFLGFMPGFAYLGDVPEEIRAPRLATPRKGVPPGSVGVAGAQTGIYPVESPGGWNLIGSTNVVLFDRSNGKSLIEPGDRVRFIPV
jgi:KipI family sensor histidine kinase inhibitor